MHQSGPRTARLQRLELTLLVVLSLLLFGGAASNLRANGFFGLNYHPAENRDDRSGNRSPSSSAEQAEVGNTHELPAAVPLLALFCGLSFVATGVLLRANLACRQKNEAVEATFATLTKVANDAIFSRTLDGKVTSWNDAAVELYGLKPDQVLGTTFFPTFTGEHREVVQIFLSRVESGELLRGVYAKYQRTNGSVRDVLLTGIPVRERSGKVSGMHILARDIGALTRAEEVQISRAIEARLRAIVDHSADALVLMDAKGQILFCSAATKALLGGPLHESSGRSIFEFIHEEDRHNVRAVLANALADPARQIKVRTRVRHENGSWLSAEAVFNNLLDVSAIQGILLNLRDITEAVNAEKAVQQSNNRFARAFHANPLALSISSRKEGRYIDVNSAFLQMFGLRRDAVIGSTSRLLNLWIEPEDRDTLLEQLSTMQKHKKPLEARMRASNGEIRDVHIYGELIEMDGQPCVLAITEDVTIAKRMESQFLRTQRMEAVGRLAGGLAHDFNNVLGVIIGHSEIAQERLPPEHSVSRNIGQIRKAAERASTLIRQLLAFSRQQLLYPRVLDLNAVVGNLNEMLAPMVGEDISIEFRPAASLGAVRADPGQIEQVIMNLVVNARDAMPTGGKLIIETKNVDLDQEYVAAHSPAVPGSYVMVAVTDTGCGISEEVIPHIFEPFFTTKVQGKGTGLGLSTVYGIVKQSGGYIWVYSELGKGTTFKIYFPIVAEHPSEPLEHKIQIPTATAQVSGTILVVEDDELLRGLVVRLLDAPGYKVLEAENAEAALQVAERYLGKIDLLLTDVIMPKLSGAELATVLRNKMPGLKVLFMSGYSSDLVAQHGATQQPGTMVIEKPFTKNAFLAQVRAALQQSAETGRST